MGAERPRHPHPETQEAMADVAEAIRSVVINTDGLKVIPLTATSGEDLLVPVASIILVEEGNGETIVQLIEKKAIKVQETVAEIHALIQAA